MISNAVSSALDDASLAAVARAADEYGLPCEESAPADIPGYRPLDNDRALRAWYLPEKGFPDGQAWLATLDTAPATQPNTTRTPAGTPAAPRGGGCLLNTPEGATTAAGAVVASGAWTTPILKALNPELPAVPALATADTVPSVTDPGALHHSSTPP
ncbi:hypothetical protein [Streptomyces sp. NBC_01306]|uniref:hypothetical protein n=1 Tax=Streptomyces sp. NBC_01306 TaxID=2903819 RepID=UPI00225B4ED2|nr:hypothetical protein [Streptomyces sp. NBC_01306]MCX4729214.1 hypothetical protein [Streptomyces sp. NBC_01306]